MRIGLDFDGVISDCGQLKSDGAKRLFGVNIPASKFKKEIVVGEGLLTLEQYRELQQQIYGVREFGLLMKPVNGVFHFLPRLIADGHTIIVVTSRGETETKIAEEWSVQHGFRLNFVSVGNKSKSDAVSGCDVYIDDDMDKLEQIVGVVQHLFLFSWDYNAHIVVGTIAKRIESWKKFFHVIQTLA